MIDWQTMDTAPKNGDEILVYANIASVDVVHIAFWNADELDQWKEQGFQNKDELVGWWSYTRGSVTQDKLDDYRTPTHWATYNPPSGT